MSLSTHCIGHITTGSFMGRGNQYIQLVKVLYCKLPTNDKELPALPPEVRQGTETRSQRWEARVLSPPYKAGTAVQKTNQSQYPGTEKGLSTMKKTRQILSLR